MKKFKLNFVLLACVLIGVPNLAFADYSGCRKAGGSALGCFWEAAMNDRIAPPQGGAAQSMYKYNEKQVKKSFARNSKYCSKVPIEKQVECLSKGMKLKQTKKINKPVRKKLAKPVSKKVSSPVSKKVSQ